MYFSQFINHFSTLEKQIAQYDSLKLNTKQNCYLSILNLGTNVPLESTSRVFLHMKAYCLVPLEKVFLLLFTFTYRLWAPLSLCCVLREWRWRWSFAVGRRGWWWASDGTCLRCSPETYKNGCIHVQILIGNVCLLSLLSNLAKHNRVLAGISVSICIVEHISEWNTLTTHIYHCCTELTYRYL